MPYVYNRLIDLGETDSGGRPGKPTTAEEKIGLFKAQGDSLVFKVVGISAIKEISGKYNVKTIRDFINACKIEDAKAFVDRLSALKVPGVFSKSFTEGKDSFTYSKEEIRGIKNIKTEKKEEPFTKDKKKIARRTGERVRKVAYGQPAPPPPSN